MADEIGRCEIQRLRDGSTVEIFIDRTEALKFVLAQGAHYTNQLRLVYYAKLNAFGRRLLIERIWSGWRVRAAAAAAGISRQRAYVLLARFRSDGVAAFAPRSSRPHRSPRRTRPYIERRIARLCLDLPVFE